MASAVVANLFPMVLNRPTMGLAFGLLAANPPWPWPGGIKKLSIMLLGVVWPFPKPPTAIEDDEEMTCVCGGACGCACAGAGCANT